jgi:hypothetical protein
VRFGDIGKRRRVVQAREQQTVHGKIIDLLRRCRDH